MLLPAKSFGVRQLAPAFAARAAAGSKLPPKESGSKLPHSKAEWNEVWHSPLSS